MLSADIVVADRSTSFVPGYDAVGLPLDTELSWLLPRAIGQQRASSWLLTGRRIKASEALSWGLVREVVDDEAALTRANEIATSVVGGRLKRRSSYAQASSRTAGRVGASGRHMS